MANIIKNLFLNFKTRDSLFRLIAINAVVFILIAIVNIFCKLFTIPPINFNYWLALPSRLEVLFYHIWSVVTYMFVHYDFFHILFNMLVLYWFGKIFLMFFTQKNLVALYFYGGIAGALLFLIAYNTIPYFMGQGNVPLIGASASVSAIIFGIAFYKKDFRVNLLLFGSVKIIYIALAIFIIDFISIGGNTNEGGHIAHIGGALMGIWFAKSYLNSRDITRGLNRLIDSVFNLFKKKPKMKIKYNKREADYEFNKRKNDDSADLDKILDKIKQSGYKSLTDNERKRLFDASNK